MKRIGFIALIALSIAGIMLLAIGCSNEETGKSAEADAIVIVPEESAEQVGSTKAEQPRPEIHGTFVKLELPDQCYWVQRWNTPGFFAETVDGRLVDQGDGVSYDGHMLVNPEVKDGKVFFRLDMDGETDVKRYFRLEQLTSDPRLTNWWLAFSNDSFPSLREAVTQSAICEEYPQIAEAIIQNMIACELVASERIDSLSQQEINDILMEYGYLGYEEHYARVQEHIGTRKLTNQVFSTLAEGDTLNLYYDSDFGAVMHPISTLVVSENLDGNVTAFVPESDYTATLTWGDLERLSELIEVRKSTQGTI